MLTYLKYSLIWPYETLFSCYWGTVTLYDDFYTHDFPHWLNWRNADGTFAKYDVYGELWQNFIFNFGFIFMDWVYLLIVWGDESSYWYRLGYVSGDLYMRFFYRSLFSVPVK